MPVILRRILRLLPIKPDVEGVFSATSHLTTGVVVADGGIDFVLNLAKLIIVENGSPLELVFVRNLPITNLRTFYFHPEALDKLIDVVKSAKVRHGDDDSVTFAGSL